MVSHYAVHIPHQASPQAIERCRRRWVAAGNPDAAATDKEYKKYFPQWQYAAMVEETDASLGKILDALKESNELDNTYVIFTSDNGGGVGRRDEAGNRFQGPLQEGKRSTFEGGLRVPLEVSGPGIKPGLQCDVPVVGWDFYLFTQQSDHSRDAIWIACREIDVLVRVIGEIKKLHER